MPAHQYIDRRTGQVRDEQLLGDQGIRLLYSQVRESAPWMFRALTSRRITALLGLWQFDLWSPYRGAALLARMGVDARECLHPVSAYRTPRQVFERQIRYWSTRPMDDDPRSVVAPADSRALLGSCRQDRTMFIKEKFFSLGELLGEHQRWCPRFLDGDYAIFRLTPEKYHYTHAPVSGRVVDYYRVDGCCHSCNPAALVAEVSAHSKNQREITVLDTEVAGGSGVGLVAMIEVVALMIGTIVQCASTFGYQDPQPMQPGLDLVRGCPKSLFRPGSSTVILLFEPERIRFSQDLQQNLVRSDVHSRYATRFARPLVETEVQVRTTVAHGLSDRAVNPVRSDTSLMIPGPLCQVANSPRQPEP